MLKNPDADYFKSEGGNGERVHLIYYNDEHMVENLSSRMFNQESCFLENLVKKELRVHHMCSNKEHWSNQD